MGHSKPLSQSISKSTASQVFNHLWMHWDRGKIAALTMAGYSVWKSRAIEQNEDVLLIAAGFDFVI